MDVHNISVSTGFSDVTSMADTLLDEHCIPHPIACLSRGPAVGASLNCIAAFDAISSIISQRASPQIFEFLFIDRLRGLVKQFPWIKKHVLKTTLVAQFITNETLFYFIFGEGEFEIQMRNTLTNQVVTDRYVMEAKGEVQSLISLFDRSKRKKDPYSIAQHISQTEIVEEWNVPQVLSGEFCKLSNNVILHTRISVQPALLKGGKKNYVQFSFLNESSEKMD